MAMFPDSGVPPAEAKNSLPDVNTMDCDELWYSTSRCQPRFDPAAANAMLAEDMNLIMKGEVVYDCNRLDNIERAARYLIQRGLPVGGYMTQGPTNYLLALDPPLTRYNDHLTLIVVPAMNNKAATWVNIDGRGDVPILRNDGIVLRMDDLKKDRPQLISYWQGAFYFVGLAASQVPVIMTDNVDAWVRTDGSDLTGDGTANSPDKAFRTVQHAFEAYGARYSASNLYAVNIRLGIPGTYEAFAFGNSASRIQLHGDRANPAGYRIAGTPNIWAGVGLGYCCMTGGINIGFIGVTFLMDHTAPNSFVCIRFNGAVTCMFDDVRFEATVSNPNAYFFYGQGSTTMFGSNTLTFEGFGNQIHCCIGLSSSSWFTSVGHPTYLTIAARNLNLVGPFLSNASVSTFSNADVISQSNVIGRQYIASTNSITTLYGRALPGSLPGETSTGAQVT